MAFLSIVQLAVAPATAHAGCGCDKPPPPRAPIRPFFGYADQMVTLFDYRLAAGRQYEVHFTSSVDGTVDTSLGTAIRLRDLADGRRRIQLQVLVGELPLGPAAVSVWRRGKLLYELSDEDFTVVGPPLTLRELELAAQDGYRAAIGRDGTLYFPVDVTHVSDPTTFRAAAKGFPLHFTADHVVMYNTQGYLMQILDPAKTGLFRITAGNGTNSDALAYFRHEFHTYKAEHRELAARQPDRKDPAWHRDGSPHIDHNVIVVAIRGTLANGDPPHPGSTGLFRLEVKPKKSVDRVDDGDDDDHGDDHDH